MGRQVHELKTWPQQFAASRRGDKPFEVRRNDRRFRVGDMVHLREWNPETQTYTGLELKADITYVLLRVPPHFDMLVAVDIEGHERDNGLDYVVLGLRFEP